MPSSDARAVACRAGVVSTIGDKHRKTMFCVIHRDRGLHLLRDVFGADHPTRGRYEAREGVDDPWRLHARPPSDMASEATVLRAA
jgi:hypothetical protein